MNSKAAAVSWMVFELAWWVIAAVLLGILLCFVIESRTFKETLALFVLRLRRQAS